MEPGYRCRRLTQLTDHRGPVERAPRPMRILLQHPRGCDEIVEAERRQQGLHVGRHGYRFPQVDTARARILSIVDFIEHNSHPAIDVLRARVEYLEAQRRRPEDTGDERESERGLRPAAPDR